MKRLERDRRHVESIVGPVRYGLRYSSLVPGRTPSKFYCAEMVFHSQLARIISIILHHVER